jgi:anti-sigma regulatory factor (Ser/Thr protein kinase)
MACSKLLALTSWITAAAEAHPGDLADALAMHAGVTRRTALRRLRELTQAQWLIREGSIRRPIYRPGLLRQVVRRYPIEGLAEDRAWARDFAAHFRLPPSVRRIAQHAFGELLNNAIDHSEGTGVTVSMRQTPCHLQLLVSDDGRGLFDKLRNTFALDDPREAMLELSKGKLTTQPERHAGQGLFFISRLADVFDLHANAQAFQHRHWEEAWSVGTPLGRQGTSVYFAVALDTERSIESVIRSHSQSGRDVSFDRTVVPMRLAVSEFVELDSRAQARRVAARLHRFKSAELDFDGIGHVGQGFADELFRVLPRHLPELRLTPVNMNAEVAATVAAVLA